MRTIRHAIGLGVLVLTLALAPQGAAAAGGDTGLVTGVRSRIVITEPCSYPSGTYYLDRIDFRGTLSAGGRTFNGAFRVTKLRGDAFEYCSAWPTSPGTSVEAWFSNTGPLVGQSSQGPVRGTCGGPDSSVLTSGTKTHLSLQCVVSVLRGPSETIWIEADYNTVGTYAT